jgi:hypothetical protein
MLLLHLRSRPCCMYIESYSTLITSSTFVSRRVVSLLNAGVRISHSPGVCIVVHACRCSFIALSFYEIWPPSVRKPSIRSHGSRSQKVTDTRIGDFCKKYVGPFFGTSVSQFSGNANIDRYAYRSFSAKVWKEDFVNLNMTDTCIGRLIRLCSRGADQSSAMSVVVCVSVVL